MSRLAPLREHAQLAAGAEDEAAGGPEQQRCDRAARMRALLRDMFQGRQVFRAVAIPCPRKRNALF